MMENSRTMNDADTKSRGPFLDRARKPAPIRLLTSTILRGCNVHHGSTVIRQEVDLGGLTGIYSAKAGPEFARRFLDRFFDLRRMVPESGMTVSFLQRLNSPTGARFEEVLFEAILAVETSMTHAIYNLAAINFAEIVHATSSQSTFLVWECKVPRVSRGAAAVGLTGLVELLPEELRPHREDGSEDFETAFAVLERCAQRQLWSTSSAVLALAAKRRGLPCEFLGGPYLRLGHGASQQVFYASVTERTSLAASQLSRNKHKTNRRLAELRLPVARQIKVTAAEEGLTAAETLGFPVVIKPLKAKQASGVSVGIKDPSEIPSAFERAHKTGFGVIVESFVPGQVYRLLVIDGRFVAALKITPPTVTGDGKRTIAELVEEVNDDPLRDGVRLERLKIDDEMTRDLKLSGYGLGDVLQKDKTIAVRAAANVGIGGVHTDVTDSVHPDNQEMAIRATEGIGLDVAGVDFVTEDASQSYNAVGGSIIEINARPGLCMHVWPRYGKSRNVGEAMLALSFPSNLTGRIPTMVVAGDRGTGRVAQDLDLILRASGKTVGLATRKGSFVSGQAAEIEASQQRNAARNLLRDPRIEALISAVSPRQVVKRGLVLDTCDVAAITNRAADRDADAFQQGLEIVVKATRGIVAVNARNKLALKVLSTLDTERLVLLSSGFQDPTTMRHLAAGGTVVSKVRKQDQDRIVLYSKDRVIASIPVATTHTGERASARCIETRMFAVALAFGIGLSGKEIEAAAAFPTPPDLTPDGIESGGSTTRIHHELFLGNSVQKRKQYSAGFKARVALEALKETETTNEFSFVLKPAKYGVGVFAVHDIRKEARLHLVRDMNKAGNRVRVLRKEDVPEAFQDYCIVTPEALVCPHDFGAMSIGWYLNHSNTPNVSPRNVSVDTYLAYNWYAVRDISAGEEILIDYNVFGEPEEIKDHYYRS